MPRDLPVDKPAALLYYLARRPDWVERAELAFLFRPDAPEDVALGNVRVLLHRARSRGWPGELTIEKTRVRYSVATDVEAFERAVENGAWEEALRLYRGPFLAGVGSAGVAGFEAWLDLERRDVAAAWRRAALGLARERLAQGKHQEAVEWLDRIVADDPLDEEAVQELLRAHLAAGDRRTAETAWNDFRVRLADELGLEPLESSQALAAALTAKEPASTLPAPTTPFVGRRAELVRLSALLADDKARLITLIGLGGSGKTRLALEAARNVADRFRDGAWFVPLAGVTSAETLVPAIGAAVGWAFTGPGPLDAQVFDYLRRKQMLLILDNFEDLVATPATSTLAALLESSPDLHLLVTSRAALQLGAETLFDVDGLPYPATADDAPATYDAVRLFADRAGRLSRSFVLDGETLAAAAEIARAVEGLPLALELAATWIRTLSPQEIAREVRSNPEVLSGRVGDLPERQRSIARVLDSSFERLGRGEREAVGRLALFRGGFTREAAERVAGVHLAMLLSLINHALLRRGQDGRFGMHELVRQYAAAGLDAATRRRIRAGIARYYLDVVRATAPELRGAGYTPARNRLLAEIDNVRLATEVALADDPRGLADVAGPLRALYLELGYTAEATEVFTELLTRYDADADPDGELVAARVALQNAGVSFRAGRIAQGWDILQRVLPVLRREGTPSDRIAALNWAATTARLLGRQHEAGRFAGESLALSRKHGNDLERSDALFVSATVQVDAGAVDEALELLADAAALRRAQGDEVGALDADVPRAQVLLRGKGDVAAARPILESALETARRLGVPRLEGNVISTLAVLAMQQGDHEEGARLHRASLAVARASGNRHHQVVAMNNLAGALNALGRHEEARDQLLAASALCAEVGVPDAQVQASFLLAENARLRGVESEAWGHFASALRTAILHPVPGHAITQGLALLVKMHDHVGDHDRASELRAFLVAHPETSAPLRARLAREVDGGRSGGQSGDGNATDLPAMLKRQLELADAASADDPAA